MNDVFRVLSLAGGLAVLLTGCADAPLSADAPEVETKSLFETRYEAEHHAAMDGCETGSSRSGFTGDGYMKFGPEGAFVEWAGVEVPDSDTYAITLRYSARGDATRQGKFMVNGEPVEFLRFTRTGDTWSD